MATINLIERKPKKENYSNKNENEIFKTIYNTNTWRTLRLNYLIYNPICEKCNNVLATEVHHKQEISTATNKEEMKRIGFDEKNLMAVCNSCHKEIHNKLY